ncbi:NAD(P)H-hydrate dehydratase [Sphingomonadaceae bacterium jetA1]|jgi:hydroxyethylthiazole kinase-like uncharacterized protein yjeF|uniref:NAD(P)H-hydrate dehydratase n=1 Tax=Facivitalis istanbulensis TaxID=3075838 RepID=UPI0034867E81
MIPSAGRPVLTAQAMRAAEAAAMAAGTTEIALMRRAGEGIAQAILRLAAGRPVLVLCGPGHNGGDGFVAAAALRRQRQPVRVAAFGEPRSETARWARSLWDGPVVSWDDVAPAPVLVDAIFGTGLSRAPDERIMTVLRRCADAAILRIAVDLPSGIESDAGRLLADVPAFDVTLATGAIKPSHLVQPAARCVGQVRLIDIGIPIGGGARVASLPRLPHPDASSHKYSRGMVAIVAGAMGGAAELAATAALRAGAGYVLHLDDRTGVALGPNAIVRRSYTPESLTDNRIGAIVIGPGLGRDDTARARLGAALGSGRPLVIDGDALRLIEAMALADHIGVKILTPHGGEFAHMFGDSDASKPERARKAAAATRSVVVFKGADTVIAAPDGRTIFFPPASPWLSTAGTGDVLAGTIGAMLAAGLDPLEAAEAGVWLHGEAARRCGAAFIADDLADALSAVRG